MTWVHAEANDQTPAGLRVMVKVWRVIASVIVMPSPPVVMRSSHCWRQAGPSRVTVSPSLRLLQPSMAVEASREATSPPSKPGAPLIDGSLRGMGAGAGNAMTEAVVAVLNKAGYQTGIDLYKLMDVGEQKVKPLMPGPQEISNAALTLGYAGVYSSFLLHSIRAGQKYNLDPRDILMELGKRRTVGGQEDWIVDVAAEMAAKR